MVWWGAHKQHQWYKVTLKISPRFRPITRWHVRSAKSIAVSRDAMTRGKLRRLSHSVQSSLATLPSPLQINNISEHYLVHMTVAHRSQKHTCNQWTTWDQHETGNYIENSSPVYIIRRTCKQKQSSEKKMTERRKKVEWVTTAQHLSDEWSISAVAVKRKKKGIKERQLLRWCQLVCCRSFERRTTPSKITNKRTSTGSWNTITSSAENRENMI